MEARKDRIRRYIILAVVVATGLLNLVLPVLALHTARIPFPGLLVDPNLVVNAGGESDWPARTEITPPVTYPERITAVDGQPITNIRDYWNRLATYQVGDTIELTLVQPDNSRVPPNSSQPERTVSVPLINWSTSNLWNQFWLFYLTGLITFIIGTVTFYIRPKAESAQILALFASLVSVSMGALFDQVTTQYFVRLWVFALAVVGTANFLLANVFPHETRLFARYPILKWILFIPGILIGIWGQLWLHSSDPWAYAIPWRAAYFLNGVMLAGTWLLLGYRAFVSPSVLVRQQSRLILMGALLGFLPLFSYFSLAAANIPTPWLKFSLTIPPAVIYPLAIAYTIMRYRLLNVDVFLRQGVTFGAITLVLAIALTLLITGLTSALGSSFNLDNPVFLAFVIILVAFIFEPLRSRVQQSVDQYLFRQPVALDEYLRAFSRELTTAVNTEQVANVLLKYVAMGIPQATPHLYLPDLQNECYCEFTDQQGDNGHKQLIESDSAVVQFMREKNILIDLAEERAWPRTLREHREQVLALKAAVLAPMHNGQELLGWLAISPKENHQYFTPSELNYIEALADQAVVGLERASVISRLETRIAELDQLSQFSQALNFTIDPDALMELIYTNYHRMLGVVTLGIVLRDPETRKIYTAFYVEGDERYFECEGKDKLVENEHIRQVVETGQPLTTTDENGRTWIIAPLNAGAEALGALYTWHETHESHFRQRQEQLFAVLADRSAAALDRLQTRRQLEDRARQLEIINEVTFSLASTLELEPLLNLVLDKAMELLDTEAGTFMLIDEDTGELEFRVVRGPASQELVGTRLPIGTGLAGTVAQTGRPTIVNRAQEDRRWFSGVDANTEFHTESILTVPLLRQNTVQGVLQVINKRNGAPFDEEDQQLLMAFASQAVVALENARLLQQTDRALQERVNELFMLQQLDRDLNTTLELNHVLSLTLDWVLRICDATAGGIIIFDEDGRPYLHATRGYDPDFDPSSLDLEKGLVGYVLKTGQPHITGNVHEEEGYIPATFDTHSQMTLPIIHKQQLIGAIAIESNKFDAFTEKDLERAMRVTNHAAVAIANAILYEQVNAANMAKSEFVSMVSHELKTPMTSMRGYTDLMLSGMTGELTPQQRSFLETIAANIRRMSQQIQDLTDISRIETGRLRMEFAPTAFSSVVSETLQTIRPLAEEKNIELKLDLPVDLPLVMADKDRLVQVLTNLLSNACKYSPPETTVRVTVRPEIMNGENDHPQSVVLCAVQDEGYGISEEDQKKLFTKFFRADDPNIRKASGTGLGLSITKGIVELHGGKIWVESTLGKGTTFYFTIPQATD
ncbi:MAG: GAF domain-containing protein [Chloroflexi bacterium]|nr:MAG: GAF domain-containing protein [Chloroflexota bacterium]